MKRTNYSFLIFSIFFISIFVVSINQYIDISHAQANDETIILSSNFSMRESTEYIDSNTSVSSITIPLPSEKWNITNIQMNISDIKLGKEIKTIEDKGQSFQIIDSKGKLGYGVELNITEPTIIFGVYIYGYVTGTPVLPVYVQIQGYDGGTDAPDENVLGSTLINMSTPGWHLQMFDKEVSLSVPGSYYLVINGSELTFPADKSTYNWLYNGSGSTHNLYTALYDGDWKQDSLGIPFLHKLIQRVNRSFNPEEVNMTAEFNGSSYPILDGPVESTGNLTINEIIAPNNTIFNIAIKNNRSIDLIFNLSYQVNIVNNFFSDAQVELKDNSANKWTLTPDFNMIYNNYTIKFSFPSPWYNFSVRRNGVDITSNVTINALDNYILFPVDVMMGGASWEIYANSPNVALSLNTPKLKFEPNQDLEFSVLPPINPGNLTYILINSLGFEDYQETIEISSTTTSEIVFSYQLSANPNEGIYWAYIYWFDGVSAGLKSQSFQVNVPFVLDPIYIVIIIVGSITIVGASFSSYKLIKRSKRIHQEYRKKIYNKYMDVLNLEYFIIIEKRTGLNIYEQILAGKDMDASLITGFLEAIRSFGIELTGANEQSQTIKLEYHQSKVIMSEFKDFRILLIMKENPSQDFLDSIKSLSYEIDQIYGEEIAKFKGNIDKFTNIRNLLDKHLETSLIYPLELKPQNVKISSDEKALITRAEEVMKMRKTDYFFLSYLLYARKGFQIKDAETVLNLIEKKIFQPKI
ncbi:MAG: hypothetical protein ACFE8B_16400 [Candidatus Hermodarchaeota archaeon]